MRAGPPTRFNGHGCEGSRSCDTIAAVRLRLLAFAAGVAIGMLVTVRAEADCVRMSPRQLKDNSTPVLEGTVQSIEDAAGDTSSVTVQVHRVWKGNVTRTAVFYYVRALDATPEPPLKIGDRRLFFGWRSEEQPTMLMVGCNSAPVPKDEIVAQLGRSRTPH